MSEVNTTPFNRQWSTQKLHQKVSAEGNTSSLSVATYNILQDSAIRRNPHYQYVPARCRYMDNRHPRIMQEMSHLQPDVVCFQEVEESHFKCHMAPDMADMGYAGQHFPRSDDSGLATFYNSSRFQLTGRHSRAFADILTEYTQGLPISEEMKTSIAERLNLPQLVGMVRLLCKATQREIVVGNLHTYWKYEEFPATITLQVCAAIKELQKFCQDESIACILCGDFNSPPRFPPYKLISDGSLDEESLALCNKESRLVVSDMEVADLIEITGDYWKSTKSNFTSAYREIMGSEPTITNADDSEGGKLYTGCLDYIWFNPTSLKVKAVLETPTDESILEHVALPSVTFPSDHIYLMAKFGFI